MKLRRGKSYTNDSSDLAVKVLNIYHFGDGYVKIRGMLYEKRRGIVIETKGYKLLLENIGDWYEIFTEG